MTNPVKGNVSIARRLLALPCWTPFNMMRAAVRCEMPLPSPSRMMMFLACGASCAEVIVSRLHHLEIALGADDLTVALLRQDFQQMHAGSRARKCPPREDSSVG